MPWTFIFAFFWGLIILLAFFGWGNVFGRIFFPKTKLILGLKAVLGMSLAILYGGVLNQFNLVSKQNIFIFLGLGIIFLATHIWKAKLSISYFWKECTQNRQASKAVFLLTILLFVFIGFSYSLTVYNKQFHGYDDYQTYLAFPAKMLEAGSLGADPYSETRIVTSFGGKYFLDTFILSVLPFNSLHLIDNGLALLILLILVYGISRKFEVSKTISLFVVFTVSLVVLPSGNITSLATSIAVFLSLLLFLYKERFFSEKILPNALVFALLLSTFLSLKSNTIPVASVFLVGLCIFELLKSSDKIKIIKLYLISGLLSFIFLLPWMLSMHYSSGTLLYPIFGKGFHGSVYGSLPAAYSGWGKYNFLPIVYDLLSNFLFWALFVCGVCYLTMDDKKNSDRQKVLLLLRVAAVSLVINAFLTGGYGTYRYSFSYIYPIVIFSLIIFLKNGEEKHPVFHVRLGILGLVIFAMLAGSGFNTFLANLKQNFDKFTFAVSSKNNFLDRIDQKIVEDYNKMQNSVSEGETLLVRLQFPFLLDFKRNQIFLTDYMGGASPPPGLPLYKGPEPLAEYLLLNHIKYVAYSYKSEIGFTREIFSWQLPESGNWRSYNPWLRAEVENTLDFQANLKELGKTRKRIYDDGEIFVLDLSKKI